MIQIAICDDEKNIREDIALLIQRQPYPCKITEYAAAKDCLLDILKIDILFLDIELHPLEGDLDGMTLAKKVREQDLKKQPIIVFITGYEQYVFEAFDVNAFQYLLKPVDEEKFAQVFAKAARKIIEDREKPLKPCVLTLRIGNTNKTVFPDQISYIESSNHKVVLHLQKEKITCYAKMSDLEMKLQGQFFRIHKGYLVNLAVITAYSRTEVTLRSGERLLLSKYKYQDFVKAYIGYLKRRSGL